MLSRCLQARPTSDRADILGLDGTPQTPQGSDLVPDKLLGCLCQDVGFGEGAMPNTLRGWQEAGRSVVRP
eukprot:COSAG04_NODE_203_length_20431_cov_12.598269_20_plen_70_part_00